MPGNAFRVLWIIPEAVLHLLNPQLWVKLCRVDRLALYSKGVIIH